MLGRRFDSFTGRHLPPELARVCRRVAWRVILESFVVVVLTTVVSSSVTPPDSANRGELRPLAIVEASMFVVAVVIDYLLLRRYVGRNLWWLLDGRRPTAEERRAVRSLPRWYAKVMAVTWVAAAAVTAVFDVGHFGLGRIAVLGVLGALLGGGIAAALTFLVTEGALVPVASVAMADERLTDHQDDSLLIRQVSLWVFASGTALAGTAFGAVAAAGAGDYQRFRSFVVYACGSAFVLGAATAFITGHRLDRQVQRLRAAFAAVQGGDLWVRVEVDDGGSMGSLEAGFNQMADALVAQRRFERVLAHQVGDAAVAALLDAARTDEAQADLEHGSRVHVSVLFIDLADSTGLAERMEPEALVQLLNTLFEVVVDVIAEHGGWVNRFLGDAALCVFGAPERRDDHQASALAAAADLHERLAGWRSDHGVAVGVGVASGEVVLGNIGSARRHEFTVIGDAVNVASRLSALAKQRPGHVVATAATVAAASSSTQRWQPAGAVELRGKRAPTDVCELVQLSGTPVGDEVGLTA